MSEHAITKAEMQSVKIGVVMASSSDSRRQTHKRLMFTYDVGRKRLEYIVFTRNDDPGYAFDTLEEAIEAYNEA